MQSICCYVCYKLLSFECEANFWEWSMPLRKKYHELKTLLHVYNSTATIRYILDSQRRYFMIPQWTSCVLFARGGWLLSGDERWLANSSPILPVIGAKLLRFIPVFQPNWTRSWFIPSFKLLPLCRNVRYLPKCFTMRWCYFWNVYRAKRVSE